MQKMNAINFTAIVLASILNPILILGSVASVLMGEYLVGLALLPLTIIFWAKSNQAIVNLGVAFNIILFLVPVFYLVSDVAFGTGYYIGPGLILMCLLYLVALSNIVVLLRTKNA